MYAFSVKFDAHNEGCNDNFDDNYGNFDDNYDKNDWKHTITVKFE